jgi:hypothetical protein
MFKQNREFWLYFLGVILLFFFIFGILQNGFSSTSYTPSAFPFNLFQEEQIFFAVDSLKDMVYYVLKNTNCPIKFHAIQGNHDRIGGYENRTVTLQQVPISWISFVIKDTKLAEAVKLLPDYDISIPYSFASSDEETGEASKMGKIIYSDSKVPVTLNYGGKQHLVLFNFKCPSQFVFDADKRPISPGRIQLELKSIIVDNVIVQEIDGYLGEEYFLSIMGKTDPISK